MLPDHVRSRSRSRRLPRWPSRPPAAADRRTPSPTPDAHANADAAIVTPGPTPDAAGHRLPARLPRVNADRGRDLERSRPRTSPSVRRSPASRTEKASRSTRRSRRTARCWRTSRCRTSLSATTPRRRRPILIDLQSDDKTPVKLADGIDYQYTPMWSPDGELLYMRRYAGPEFLAASVSIVRGHGPCPSSPTPTPTPSPVPGIAPWPGVESPRNCAAGHRRARTQVLADRLRGRRQVDVLPAGGGRHRGRHAGRHLRACHHQRRWTSCTRSRRTPGTRRRRRTCRRPGRRSRQRPAGARRHGDASSHAVRPTPVSSCS